MARCGTELNALDDAVLRLKIGLEGAHHRPTALEVAGDLANLGKAFARVAACARRTR